VHNTDILIPSLLAAICRHDRSSSCRCSSEALLEGKLRRSNFGWLVTCELECRMQTLHVYSSFLFADGGNNAEQSWTP
jgi:hypothetical protein